MSGPVDEDSPLVWRVSPVQTALLFLLVSGCAALNIYAHPSGPVRAATAIVGLAALLLAVAAVRMVLVVDPDGVAVRHLRRMQWLPWSEIDGINLVSGVRGADTIRFTRADGTWVDVPPSLLQPSKPTTRATAWHLLGHSLDRIETYRKIHS